MNRTLASIRISTALLLATLLTAALFTLLRSMTVLTYIPEVIEPFKINFTRQIIDTDVKNKRDIVKVERPPIVEIDPPPTMGQEDARTLPIVVRLDPKIVPAVPAADGMAFGSDRDVVPIVRIQPDYPQRAATRGTEGWVQVRFNINQTGSVTDVVVVASEPAGVFDNATIDAVARWRYNPKVQDGVAVERRGIETLLRFDLPD